MGFMELDIPSLTKARHVVVDTQDGTYIVPNHLVNTDVLKALVDLGGVDRFHFLFDEFARLLQDYVEPKADRWNAIDVTKPGYVGRYSAPGYMDCTDWHFSTSLKELYE